MKKVILIAAAGLKALTVAVALLWGRLWKEEPDVVWQGYVEADYIKLSPLQQGHLVSLAVSRGDEVKAGDALFSLDDVAERASLDQAVRQVAQAEGQLANLRAGGKPTEIQQAVAGLAEAQALLEKSDADLRRGQSLQASGSISGQALGQLQAENASAKAKVKVAQASLAQLNAPLGRIEEIKAQMAGVESSRAAVDAATWRLSQRHFVAPTGGHVADVLARPGERVAVGTPVVSLLAPENIFVRFFVPEPKLSSVRLGDRVSLSCDGCTSDISATISFISPRAEYTPPLIYSDQSRSKLVFLIEARPAADSKPLNPGTPIRVSPAQAEATL